MANQIIGRVYQIGKTEPIQSRDGSKTYYKRELIIDATRFDPYTGQKGFDNFPSIEFSGDRCQELDQFKPGDVVAVSFDVQGTFYEKEGVTKHFNRVRGYKIEARQIQQPTAAQAPQPAPQPQPAPANNDLPWYSYGREQNN